MRGGAHEMNQSTVPDLTVQAYVRPGLLLASVERNLKHVRALESAGTIDRLLVHAWPARVPLAEDSLGQDVVELFERFNEWAAAHEVSIQPPFRVQSIYSAITGISDTILTTPALCLTVYEGNKLAGVYPHTDGDDQYTVADAIIGLKTGDLAAQWSGAPSAAATRDQVRQVACPDCEGGW